MVKDSKSVTVRQQKINARRVVVNVIKRESYAIRDVTAKPVAQINKFFNFKLKYSN